MKTDAGMVWFMSCVEILQHVKNHIKFFCFSKKLTHAKRSNQPMFLLDMSFLAIIFAHKKI